MDANSGNTIAGLLTDVKNTAGGSLLGGCGLSEGLTVERFISNDGLPSAALLPSLLADPCPVRTMAPAIKATPR